MFKLSTSFPMCRSIVSYKGSCCPTVTKPSTDAGVQEECIVMELLKGGGGLPCGCEALRVLYMHILNSLFHSLFFCGCIAH